MRKVLLVYGTSEGQTAKIAQRLAEAIRGKGYAVDVFEGRQVPKDLAVSSYAAVVIGASMHAGGYQRYIGDFVRQHRAELEQAQSAFFSVSLTEAYPPEQHAKERAELRGHIDRFLQGTGWRPGRVVSFAGALAYSRYGFLKRKLMQFIARRVGQPTDPSRDYEYTDWGAVTRFGEEFVETLRAAPPAPKIVSEVRS